MATNAAKVVASYTENLAKIKKEFPEISEELQENLAENLIPSEIRKDENTNFGSFTKEYILFWLEGLSSYEVLKRLKNKDYKISHNDKDVFFQVTATKYDKEFRIRIYNKMATLMLPRNINEEVEKSTRWFLTELYEEHAFVTVKDDKSI